MLSAKKGRMREGAVQFCTVLEQNRSFAGSNRIERFDSILWLDCLLPPIDITFPPNNLGVLALFPLDWVGAISRRFGSEGLDAFSLHHRPIACSSTAPSNS